MLKRRFKILAPLTHAEDVKLLKGAGADELYCGYVTKELTRKWPLAFNVLNRRGEGQSFEDHETFKKATELANDHGLPVYVTINGLYTPEQHPLLLELTGKLERLEGVKGVIVADLGFLLALKKNGFKKEIHISTGGTCFNSNTADFFSALGAKRIILDRQLASHEIESIMRGITSEIDIELFIIAEGCRGFIDGYCTFFHCLEKVEKEQIGDGVSLYPTYNRDLDARGCVFYFGKLAGRDYKTFSAVSYKEKRIRLKFQNEKTDLFGCRICDLYDLKEYPIKSLKIVGRGGDPKYVVRLVEFVSKALFWLTRDDISKEDYRLKCRNLFSKIIFNNKKRCTKFSCYFSPHWSGNENPV